MNYPKKRKPAGTIECEICGKIMPKRGYRGHLWLEHGLKEGINDSLKSKLAVNRYLNYLAEEHLKDGLDEMRFEYLRNLKATIGEVDEYSTGKFIFRRKNERYYSIRRLNAYDD